jgi:acyl carrier protein
MPLTGWRLYLLDPWLEPSPLGVAGEICVCGAGLARGYLGQPDLTAERFLPDPFAAEPGERLYRSGDLAVRRPGGELIYFGRSDHQLKIRGFRIEPGEIESALAKHPQVQQCVVLAREDRSGEARLVAYLQASDEHPLPADELRQFLRRLLPEPLIPASFVQLAELPLTNNGKIDRRALPAPDGSRPELDSPFISPRTSTEQALAAIWSEVLDVERPGVHDSFFALGGHSLLAIQIVSRIRDTFGVELPLRQIFETPTISELATTIDREDSAAVAEVLELVDQLSDDQVAALLAGRSRPEAKEAE